MFMYIAFFFTGLQIINGVFLYGLFGLKFDVSYGIHNNLRVGDDFHFFSFPFYVTPCIIY